MSGVVALGEATGVAPPIWTILQERYPLLPFPLHG